MERGIPLIKEGGGLMECPLVRKLWGYYVVSAIAPVFVHLGNLLVDRHGSDVPFSVLISPAYFPPQYDGNGNKVPHPCDSCPAQKLNVCKPDPTSRVPDAEGRIVCFSHSDTQAIVFGHVLANGSDFKVSSKLQEGIDKRKGMHYPLSRMWIKEHRGR